MKITQEVLNKIAHLSRLEFDEKDSINMMEDMSAIVTWVEKLKEVDTDGIEPLTTMSHEINALREDTMQSDLDKEDVLKNAPLKNEDYFRVPKVLE